ncbi:efflux RND transporter periplasmic adaptor subunit [Actibacterium sp. XHP0104]|uniref:efflux RND transporter periplasmic adaptor subunit n=1 Tax=Actibacterium sp. XHP0104 TaxID=2984335 RepID=UPI0021E9A84B|nr:HlyD family efflux transporter periplasmic adaptor subunit [Actibacterium sp. XHP0104]MCV2883025.1 HlyD family efflux transporter periplasmic adaptor subunit [Actibacterium sp. XHP0104]
MGFLRRSLAGLFLTAVTLGLLVFAGYLVMAAVQDRMASDPGGPPARERVFAVNVVQAQARDMRPELTAFGELRSRRTLDLRTKVAGTVVALHENFEEGGQVRAGELLLRVAQEDAEADVLSARADLDEAEAERRDAARALEIARDELAAAEEQAQLRAQALARQTDVRDRGYGSDALVEGAELSAAAARQAVLSNRQALANAESRVDSAETQHTRAGLALAEAERRLADTEIHAAFAGTLSGVSVVSGGLVAVNEQVAQLIAPDELEVSFRVSTAQFGRLLDDAGALITAPVTVTLDGYGADLTATGTLTRESGAVGEGLSGRLLFARLDTAPGLRPGDFVTVRLQEPELHNVVLVPATALDAGNTVLALGADDRLEEIPTRLIRRQGDDVILAADGLEGREIVAERAPVLGAGIKVRPLRPSASAQPDTPEMLTLDPERRARLIAFVEGNSQMPAEVKERVLAQLAQDQVPAQTVERLESRMGG